MEFRFFKLYIFCIAGLSCFDQLSASSDATLLGLSAAAASAPVFQVQDGTIMQNYIKTHLKASSDRLASVCNMTARTFSGSVADMGAIWGVRNNTAISFDIMQNGNIIDQINPGWNHDIVLNLAGLSSSSGAGQSLTIVPTSADGLCQLSVAVMTGKQLFEHINALSSAASSQNSGIAWFKNGAQQLPSKIQQSLLQNDIFLVVENQATSSSDSSLAGDSAGQNSNDMQAASRVQVLDLTNLNNQIFTVSLTISDLAVAELSGYYSIAIGTVSLVSKVPGHNVPLLLVPRKVFQASSSLSGAAGYNSVYANYISSYAQSLANAHASLSAMYWDLARYHTHEPYEILRLLGYYDIKNSLLSVVDNAGQASSGSKINNLICTDVYGAFVSQISNDLSWVQATSAGFNIAQSSPFLISFGPKNAVSDQHAWKMSETLWSGVAPKQAKTMFASNSNPEFPSTHASSYVFQSMNSVRGYSDDTGAGGLNLQILGANNNVIQWAYLDHGDPNNITQGQSFNAIGTFPSKAFCLSDSDWDTGYKMVPVMYDVNSCTPILTQSKINGIGASSPAALYFYTFNGNTGEFLGMMAGRNNFNAAQVQTIAAPVKWINIVYLGGKNITFPIYTVTQGTNVTGLTISSSSVKSTFTTGWSGFAYPDNYMYLVTKNTPNTGKFQLDQNDYRHFIWPALAFIVNKNPNGFADISTMLGMVWKKHEACVGNIVSSVKAGTTVSLSVQPVSPTRYQITMTDSSGTTLSQQEVMLPAGSNQMMVADLDATGKSIASSVTPIKLTSSAITINIAADATGKLTVSQPVAKQTNATKNVTPSTPDQSVAITNTSSTAISSKLPPVQTNDVSKKVSAPAGKNTSAGVKSVVNTDNQPSKNLTTTPALKAVSTAA